MDNLTKDINIFQGIAVVVVALLGSGVFIVPAIGASISGANSLLAWVLISFAILPIAYTFGIFGKTYPHFEGSAYFIQKTFGKNIGKTVGLMYLSIIPIGPPVVIVIASSYLTSLVSGLSLVVASGLMIFVIYILNQFRFSISSNISMVVVFVILCIIAIITYAAVSKETAVVFGAFDNSFLVSVGIMFWCFVGIEAISHMSSEFKNPSDFSKVAMSGIVIVAILYTSVGFAVLKFGMYGDETTNIHSLISIFDDILPVYGGTVLSIVGFLICLIAVHIYVASFTRILYSYSKPTLTFHQILVAICITIATTTAMKIYYSIDIERLMMYANGVFVLIYFLVALSGAVLFEKIDKVIAILSVVLLSIIIYIIGFSMVYAVGAFAGLWAVGSVWRSLDTE